MRERIVFAAVLVLALVVALCAWRGEPEFPAAQELAAPDVLAAHARFERALDQRVTLKLQGRPLSEAAEQLTRQVGVPLRIDRKALEDASIGQDTPVSLEIRGITLRSALGRMLGPLDLAWRLDDDAIVISTPERVGNEQIVMVYPVRDLVAVKNKSSGAMANPQLNYQQLIDLITATMAPTTWEGSGPAPLYEEPASGTIVFEQSRAVHDQVAQLLAALRQARAAQGLRPGEVEVAPPRWMQRNATGQPGGGFY